LKPFSDEQTKSSAGSMHPNALPARPPAVTLADFTLGPIIGDAGSYGQVHRARRNLDGLEVALKRIRPGDESSAVLFYRELDALASQDHPTILKCIGYIPPDDAKINDAGFVFELAEGGSVASHLERERLKKADPHWDATRKHIILYGVALGLSILHDDNLVHRDLKPANILLDDNLEPKIGDFGSSKRLDGQRPTEGVGTVWSMAPEVIESHGYDTQCDVHSFGMLAYHLLTGTVPFVEYRNNCVLISQKIQDGERPKIPPDLPECYKALIQACWLQNPTTRPTMRHLLALLSSCSHLASGIDVPTFLAYRGKFPRKAEIAALGRLLGCASSSKVIFLGGPSVGKTSLFQRLSGEDPTHDQPATTGPSTVQFWTRLIDGTTTQLAIWDTAGEERYRAITLLYLRECACALMVFDVNRHESLDDLPYWIKWLRCNGPSNAQLLLIGTQTDGGSRKVSTEEGQRFAQECGAFSYIECSAMTRDNVHEIVDQLGAFLPEHPADAPAAAAAPAEAQAEIQTSSSPSLIALRHEPAPPRLDLADAALRPPRMWYASCCWS
jgi:small GTP-binding protein